MKPFCIFNLILFLFCPLMKPTLLINGQEDLASFVPKLGCEFTDIQEQQNPALKVLPAS